MVRGGHLQRRPGGRRAAAARRAPRRRSRSAASAPRPSRVDDLEGVRAAGIDHHQLGVAVERAAIPRACSRTPVRPGGVERIAAALRRRLATPTARPARGPPRSRRPLTPGDLVSEVQPGNSAYRTGASARYAAAPSASSGPNGFRRFGRSPRCSGRPWAPRRPPAPAAARRTAPGPPRCRACRSCGSACSRCTRTRGFAEILRHRALLLRGEEGLGHLSPGAGGLVLGGLRDRTGEAAHLGAVRAVACAFRRAASGPLIRHSFALDGRAALRALRRGLSAARICLRRPTMSPPSRANGDDRVTRQPETVDHLSAVQGACHVPPAELALRGGVKRLRPGGLRAELPAVKRRRPARHVALSRPRERGEPQSSSSAAQLSAAFESRTFEAEAPSLRISISADTRSAEERNDRRTSAVVAGLGNSLTQADAT